ncbi:hypothetical protein [Synechocystis salina]|nr:hypothetical protein [Synechocystis salina]
MTNDSGFGFLAPIGQMLMEYCSGNQGQYDEKSLATGQLNAGV